MIKLLSGKRTKITPNLSVNWTVSRNSCCWNQHVSFPFLFVLKYCTDQSRHFAAHSYRANIYMCYHVCVCWCELYVCVCLVVGMTDRQMKCGGCFHRPFLHPFVRSVSSVPARNQQCHRPLSSADAPQRSNTHTHYTQYTHSVSKPNPTPVC